MSKSMLAKKNENTAQKMTTSWKPKEYQISKCQLKGPSFYI